MCRVTPSEADLCSVFLTVLEIESSFSLVFLKLAPSRKDFVWFGHLGGPIMENYVSLCICRFTKKDVGNHVFSFQQNKGGGVFKQNKGVSQHRRGSPNIGGGY